MAEILNKPDIPEDLGDLTNNAGYTKNTGTITGITMNGASKGTSGVVDLGTVITEHQSLSAYATTSAMNTALAGKQNTINDLASIRINSGKGVADMSSNADGTVVYTLANGDTYTLDLNHEHPQYLDINGIDDYITAGTNVTITKDPQTGVIVISASGGNNGITGITMNGNNVTVSNGIANLGAVITAHQDISGKANASEMAVSTSGDQTTITLKTGTSATVINQHQSLSGYVKYVLLADEAAYTALATKDSGTLYLIPES